MTRKEAIRIAQGLITDFKYESKTIVEFYNVIIKEFIKENFEPVENKPGYVWFSKSNFQIISIDTFAKLLKDEWTRLYNSPLIKSEDKK